MGNTSIQWTQKSWNPTRGCSRVSLGCVNCYAERQAARFSANGAKRDSPFHGFVTITNSHPAWTGRVELIESKLEEPLHWYKPCRVFVNSMSDLFHEALPFESIRRVWSKMNRAHWHTYQILTKRSERMAELVPQLVNIYGVLPQVWLGVSVEDQQRADERIPLLLETPAAVRFISYEPALGPVDFSKWINKTLEVAENTFRGLPLISLDLVIIGGESGPGARPFDIAWARDVVQQCKMAGVAVFYKQGGASNACEHDRKGGHFECFPLDLRIREFPRSGL